MCIVIYIENAYLYCSGCILFRYISTECNIHYSTKPTSLTIVIENWLCSVGNFSQFFLSHFPWSVLYTAFMTTLLFFCVFTWCFSCVHLFNLMGCLQPNVISFSRCFCPGMSFGCLRGGSFFVCGICPVCFTILFLCCYLSG